MKDKQTEKQEPTKADVHQDGANKTDNEKNIDAHKQAAAHHLEAAKHHLAAAENHQKGEHEKAAHNTMLAYGHSSIAGGFLTDDAKHHAQQLKQTNYQ